MERVQYDFTSMNEFVNRVVTPDMLCDQLMDLAFNYTWCVNEEIMHKFKNDMATLYMLINEFKILAGQELRKTTY